MCKEFIIHSIRAVLYRTFPLGGNVGCVNDSLSGYLVVLQFVMYKSFAKTTRC